MSKWKRLVEPRRESYVRKCLLEGEKVLSAKESNLRRIILFLALSFCACTCFAQQGTAPNGYYPQGYNGDIFSGTLTKAENDVITLTYTKGSKTEEFEGKLQAGCDVPRTNGEKRPLTASEIPLNSKITAFYKERTVKENGAKHKENEVIAISFDEVGGRKVPDDAKAIYYCLGKPTHTLFRAFH